VPLFPSLFGLNTVSAGVTAFGKHPVYADHLPDMGDTTALASRLRQTFYTGGIIARVGDWETLQKSGNAIPFGHFVLYRETDAGAGGAALLRLWPSRDKVNRTDFPMILAAVTSGVATDWLLAHAPTVLMEAEPKCKAAKSLESLSAAVQAASEALHSRSPSNGNGADKRAAEAVKELLSDPGVDGQIPNLVAALRPIWEFLPLDDDDKARLPDRAATSRAAVWASPPLEGLARWSALLDTALAGRKSRYFLIAPDNGQWIDLIIGEPGHRQFTCLRAGIEAIAPASPKPDELTDDFGGRAVDWLRKLAGGHLPLS
jgi:hypothetical protein